MAANQTGYTLTKVPDAQNISIGGSLRLSAYDVTPTASSYFTTGYLIVPSKVSLRAIFAAIITSQVPPGGTPLTGIIVPIWDVANTALQLFTSAGATPAGTIAAPTITVPDPTVVVKGGGGGQAMTLNPDSNSGVLTKAAATDRAIPFSTLMGVAITATSSAPVFTGTAIAAGALSEVASAGDVSAYVFRCLFIGN